MENEVNYMLAKEQISEVLNSQNENFRDKNTGLERESLPQVAVYENFASIITGIRRSGKSTLLLQLMSRNAQDALFLNFEDPRFAGFKTDDFTRLNVEINRRNVRILFFDEIQMLENWELFVRQKLEEGFKVVVTGSNATLLSRELGTKLTGRHLDYELFPFSYREFLSFMNLENNDDAAMQYLQKGGFPDFLKTGNGFVLNGLLGDILNRDIAVRYAVRDVSFLRQLAVYLISNIGKPVSANRLSRLFDTKAVSTILEYFSHLENAYVLQFVPKFSYSLKKQIRNEKKVYVIDLGLFSHNSIVFTEEYGRRLENTVYLHLRRKHKEIYYFNEKKECDFIVIEKGKPVEIIQACYEVTSENMNREFAGLMEALTFLGEKKGKIVTFNQKDVFHKDGKEIELIPLREFLM